ncbi:DUF1700 domain-containing protein [Parachitinimonas caeni]|uniref:DUF1700 domain-containing protein n=1 Tax=Parachitinimonas caeni TaxID=3031301 RepID=A0ABT7E3Y2_9NEIS|nr:DUF1700 domain-containing protein [Parachitinimonas caeni]MDK2125607.1 DUF1700 domain-containing protein [Parachitinimonas caeni]
MNQDSFIRSLRGELKGLDPHEIEDIVADYCEYFRDGIASGRTEEDIASSLGNPRHLVRELRAESSIKQWEERKSGGNFVRMLGALVGLGFLNLILLGPVLAIITVLFALFVASIALLIAGVAALLVAAPGSGLDQLVTINLPDLDMSSEDSAAFVGLILVFVGSAWTILNYYLSKWTGTLLIKYARLNFQLIKGTA